MIRALEGGVAAPQALRGRLYLPAEEPYLEGHNTWCVNVPGSLLVIPVADIAQHLLAILCFFAQNGYAIYDDVNGRPIPGLEQLGGLVDVEEPFPLTFTEQYALTEATAELASACYAGVLLLQAMGLGGWMFDPFSMLAPPATPRSPASGSATTATSTGPHPTPPAVRACSRPTAHRTTGTWPRRWRPSPSAGSARAAPSPRHPRGPGPTARGFRGSAQVHDQAFRACVALQAQYVVDTFGKFPGTVATVFILKTTSRPTIWTWSSTTGSSSPAPTCPPTPSTWPAGTAGRTRAEAWGAGRLRQPGRGPHHDA